MQRRSTGRPRLKPACEGIEGWREEPRGWSKPGDREQEAKRPHSPNGWLYREGQLGRGVRLRGWRGGGWGLGEKC